MENFLQEHWLDITTTVLGLAYILLELKASVWMWVVGFVMQVLGIVLYYQKGLYADCGMEFYYLGMTIYGFIVWLHPRHKESSHRVQERPITHFKRSQILPWLLGTAALWMLIFWILTSYTDSTVPLADSFTTALSIVGMWALAHKYLEQWFIWIAVDIVTCCLYFYKDIPFKAGLYALYVVIAVFGYFNWKKKAKSQPQPD